MNTFASAFQKLMKNKMEWNVMAKIRHTTGRISSRSNTLAPNVEYSVATVKKMGTTSKRY